MTPRRARDKEQTIEDILQAAQKLFSERGLHGTSIRDIEQASGVSKGLILYHFESKEKLYTAVQERLVQAYAAELMRSREGSRNLQEMIQAAIHASFHHTRTGREYERIALWSYLEGQERGGGELEVQLTQGLIETMRAGQQAGLIRDDVDAFVMPFIIKGAIEYWMRKQDLIQELGPNVDVSIRQERLMEALAKIFLKE